MIRTLATSTNSFELLGYEMGNFYILSVGNTAGTGPLPLPTGSDEP